MILTKAKVLDRVVTPKKFSIAAALVVLVLCVDVKISTVNACTGDVVITYSLFGEEK